VVWEEFPENPQYWLGTTALGPLLEEKLDLLRHLRLKVGIVVILLIVAGYVNLYLA